MLAYKPIFYESNPNYNVYWYNYPSNSFGFTTNSTIWLDSDRLYSADFFDSDDDDRLSWNMDGTGGMRAGTNLWLYNNFEWKKIIYYKYCAVKPIIIDKFNNNLYENGFAFEL